jgi:WD40 repeat protein
MVAHRLAPAFLALPIIVALARAGSAEELPPDRIDPKGHVGAVLAVAYARDAKTLVTAGSDGHVKVWDLAADRLRADLIGHEGNILCLAVSPDGHTLATGGEDRTIRLWNLSDGSSLATLNGHTGAVTALAFSPDGKTLASGGPDTTIRIWDVREKRLDRALDGHDAGVQGLAFSPDGKALASASRDTTVRLWDLAGKQDPRTLGWHTSQALCVAFAPDGKTVASGGSDRRVHFWSLDETQPRGPQPAQVQQKPQPQQQPSAPAGVMLQGDVVAIAFAPNGRTVAAAQSETKTTRPAPLGSVAILVTAPRQLRGWLRGHLGPVRALAFAPGGRTLATCGDDRSVRFWDLPSGVLRTTWLGPRPAGPARGRIMLHLDPVVAVAVSPDGKTVATATGTPIVTFWDAASHEVRRRLRDPSGVVRVLAFSPDGKTLAAGGDSKAVRLWELDTLRERAVLTGHAGSITCLAFAPDGETLASGSRDASVTLWDVARAAERTTLARHTSAVTCLAFAPDGRALATGALDWTVKVWDLPSGRVRYTLDQHADAVASLAFSPDGQTLASTSRDGLAHLWDATRGTERAKFRGHPGLSPMAFLPGASALIFADEYGAIRRRDVADGRTQILRDRAHFGPITALALSRDGKTLATGGGDREVKVWDVDAELPARPFGGVEARVRSLALSADGKTLVSSSAGGIVQVWDTAGGRERWEPIRLDAQDVRIALSPDGKFLATLPVGSNAASLKVWDTATGRELPLPAAEPGHLSQAIAFTPNGRSLVSAGGPIRLFGLGRGPARTLKGPSIWVRSVAVSPDGKSIAVVGTDAAVMLWDVASGERTVTLEGHTRAVSSLAFAPDGKTLASGSLDRTVRLWDVAARSQRATLRSGGGPISALAFAPDGKVLAASSETTPAVTFWDVAAGRLAATLTLPDSVPDDGIYAVAFAPDGKALYTGGRGIAVWDVSAESRELVRVTASHDERERATLRGHTDTVRSIAVLEGGKVLVTRGQEGTVKVWDLGKGRERLTLGGGDSQILCMNPSPDGRLLAAGVRTNRGRTAAPRPQPDGEFPSLPAALPPAPAPPAGGPPRPAPAPTPAPGRPDTEARGQVRAASKPGIAQAKPGRQAAPTGPPPVEARIWSLDDGRERATLSGHNGEVVALEFSADGKALATTSRAGVVKLWDTATFKLKQTPTGRQGGVDLVQFSPDGKTLIEASAAGLVTLCDVETGKTRATFTHFGGMNAIVLSPDGQTLATAGGRVAAASRGVPVPPSDPEPGDIRLWDMATGKRSAVLPTPDGRVTRLAFSPDGKTIAAALEVPAILLWDVAATSPRATMRWPSGPAFSLAFAPDGKALASGGQDDSLRLWDHSSGHLRATLRGHDDAIDWIAFAPDGRTIFTASRDATIKLWDAATPRQASVWRLFEVVATR